uniref:Uncharacterized protein n=1 Tax=Globodera rostochiensis TaxID=31243 RepID=A0A914HYU6_GLORO
MGNIFSFELFSVDVTLVPQVSTGESVWAPLTFLLLLTLALLFLICAVGRSLGWASHNRSRNHPRAWIPPPTVMAMLALSLLLILSPVEGFPRKGAISAKTAKTFRRLGKGTVPLLATTALYFGLESFANLLEEEPGVSSLLLSVLACLGALVLLVLVKALSVLYHFLLRKDNRPMSALPTPDLSPSYELGELRAAVGELVQRSDPPHRA